MTTLDQAVAYYIVMDCQCTTCKVAGHQHVSMERIMQRIQQVYAHRSSLIGIQCPVIWTICHDSVTNSVCNMDRLHIHLIFHAMIIHLSCNPVHEFSLISINLSRTAGLTSKKFKKGYSPVATCQSLVQLMGERA